MRRIALVLTLAAACGGKSKSADTTPSGGGDDATAEDGDDSGGDLVPPERMDEITALLNRKRTAASRCLADAVNAGSIGKNARGHVALAFVIGADGHATDLKVTETSLDNEGVEACVMKKVEEIDFGPLPKALEWSFAFAFESM
ncbi:MAG: AgmX/PglI C-terminal domain-containing protein [Myxococcales bacterium]|nr:AgmX/PglI C-terminal domain-containing protein [Myxococcales bacterium]MBK7194278.1 AgmX/PglI C-terminal domain-containing protein [Myxococcales bacterium]MBP6847411.1 AgmX/PglI C-terminal domain-containing protein [Kofleriaceae bacterium]